LCMRVEISAPSMQQIVIDCRNIEPQVLANCNACGVILTARVRPLEYFDRARHIAEPFRKFTGFIMKRIRITSYFSLPTDLAEQMRGWPEFVAGDGYSVDLKDTASGEAVSVRYVEEDEDPYVIVETSNAGELFDRVLGRVVSALAAHSDNLLVSDRC
jgi:hypothetical protein